MGVGRWNWNAGGRDGLNQWAARQTPASTRVDFDLFDQKYGDGRTGQGSKICDSKREKDVLGTVSYVQEREQVV